MGTDAMDAVRDGSAIAAFPVCQPFLGSLISETSEPPKTQVRASGRVLEPHTVII